MHWKEGLVKLILVTNTLTAFTITKIQTTGDDLELKVGV